MPVMAQELLTTMKVELLNQLKEKKPVAIKHETLLDVLESHLLLWGHLQSLQIQLDQWKIRELREMSVMIMQGLLTNPSHNWDNEPKANVAVKFAKNLIEELNKQSRE